MPVILVLVLLASLAFNIAVMTVSGVYTAASTALSAAGVTTAAMRETREKAVRKKTQTRIARQTTQRVKRRVQRGAARSIGSAAGEAIPVVGAGVIAGVLALEVNDACATARDMAGLEAALVSDGDPEDARREAEDSFDCTEMIREELPDYNDLPTREEIWAEMRQAPADTYEAARHVGEALAEIDWRSWIGSAFSGSSAAAD